jgi:hypothetical protein
MPPKKKKRSKSMPKQSQSQRQSVVVNIGTSKTKSKPRKSRGRGGLPPPSYQHNLAPTFVTQQATDYNPVIGAIASLTSRLQQEPRIQNPVTPLSSATSFSTQQAQAMAGQMAEERRDGPTAGNFQPLPSQVRTETPPEEPITSKIIFTPKEKRKKKGFKPIVKLGGERKGETLDITDREADEYKTERLVLPKEDSGEAAGGGGRPRGLLSSPEALARSRQQTIVRKEKLDLIRGKIKRGEKITKEEEDFVYNSRGTKKIQQSSYIVD